MSAVESWSALIDSAPRPKIAKAVRLTRGPWSSTMRPVALLCDDGQTYVTKGRIIGAVPDLRRFLFNEQVVARLAQLIGAPVPAPALVDLPTFIYWAGSYQPAAYREWEGATSTSPAGHMHLGLCSGSLFLDSHGERSGVEHADVPENRARFASLSILYGWLIAVDPQLIYRVEPPHLVTAIDFSHFLGGFLHTAADLERHAHEARAYIPIVRACRLTHDEIAIAASALRDVTLEGIAMAFAAPPLEWGMPLHERAALADYVWRRRGQMIEACT